MPRGIRVTLTWTVVVVALLLVGCEEKASHLDGGDDDSGGPGCDYDKSVDFDTAITVAAGAQQKGWICPKMDQDFYKITIPASDKLLQLELNYITTAPRINLTYRIFDDKQVPVENAPSSVFNKFKSVHCLKPGTYYLLLEDQGSDNYDSKTEYVLSYTTTADKDTNEPNDTAATAKTLTGSATGYISCQGDKDFYKVTVGADQLLKIQLKAAQPTNVDLEYVVYDAANNQEGTGAIDDGTKPDAKLDLLQAVSKAGTYTIEVRDKGGDEADAGTAYTLTVSMAAEQDPQDKGTRNDKPQNATVVGTGGGSLLAKTYTGQIGSMADVDYFVINGLTGISESNPAVMEVILSTPAGQVPLDPGFVMIYTDSATSCTKDACCAVLKGTACNADVDCFRKSYSCVNKGDNYCLDKECSPNATTACPTEQACAGVTACMPNKFCGAEHAWRFATNKTTASTVLTSQLLIHPGPWYVRVSNRGDNKYEYGRNYTLSIKVQMDPDGAKELDNELFADRCWLVTNVKEDDRTEWEFTKHVTQAKTKIASKTIALNTWVQGYLSYEGDIDFYQLPNPCPSADCTLSIDYQPGLGCPSTGAPLRYCQDPGEVKNAMGLEFLYAIRRTTSDASMWTGFKAAAGANGTWGADGNPPLCVYSYKNHGTSPYYITVEDVGNNFWSWGCYYNFRIRKVADGCAAPCKTEPTTGNCGG